MLTIPTKTALMQSPHAGGHVKEASVVRSIPLFPQVGSLSVLSGLVACLSESYATRLLLFFPSYRFPFELNPDPRENEWRRYQQECLDNGQVRGVGEHFLF